MMAVPTCCGEFMIAAEKGEHTRLYRCPSCGGGLVVDRGCGVHCNCRRDD